MSPSKKILATISASLHLGLAPPTASAQMAPAETRQPRVDVATLLNLDTARAAQVDAILLASRQKMRALHQQGGQPSADAVQRIRAEADEQLASVLTPGELAILRDALPSAPQGRGRVGKRVPM
jgi:hypothetical protein